MYREDCIHCDRREPLLTRRQQSRSFRIHAPLSYYVLRVPLISFALTFILFRNTRHVSFYRHYAYQNTLASFARDNIPNGTPNSTPSKHHRSPSHPPPTKRPRPTLDPNASSHANRLARAPGFPEFHEEDEDTGESEATGYGAGNRNARWPEEEDEDGGWCG